ncbi:Uncharacterised protein [Serratia fonticola]|nr:Uncharacterised protein [Serratia fonticola]CAI1715058.1 Uncharacterised protein [Serratia fonticola]CAI1755473.1 Uncharacterised protein [Serratia fonticola]
MVRYRSQFQLALAQVQMNLWEWYEIQTQQQSCGTFCPLSLWERARVRGASNPNLTAQQAPRAGLTIGPVQRFILFV